jgi:SpoVK/Ycf46/Vps4 family AAA+-type ATPase
LVASEQPSVLQASQALDLSELESQASVFNAALQLSDEFLSQVTLGTQHRPQFSHNFPAKLLTTPMQWQELILPQEVMHQVEEIRAWIEHHHVLLTDWELAGKIQPGFRSLFYGPPGTGKTLTASLLGKVTGLPVYRVDLAMVVSKYIGETEKNLAKVFAQAEQNEWILFFDEADALFGKRSETKSSHDRHANQEVAFLLQRIESFPGVVLLATNLKSNIDAAFARRFQSMVRFAMPGAKEREQLWRNAFASAGRVADDVCFKSIAREHELAGGAIINILRHASLAAMRKGNEQVEMQDLQQGIRREFHKLGKFA